MKIGEMNKRGKRPQLSFESRSFVIDNMGHACMIGTPTDQPQREIFRYAV